MITLSSLYTFAQPAQENKLFLRFVSPGDNDTVRARGDRVGIAGCTIPSARVYINGTETKVYASGAFVGLVDANVGEQRLHIAAIGANGDSTVRDFIVIRREPPKATPREPVAIEDWQMEPSQDIWLGNNDVLEVRFKGSPGYKAVFDIEGVESGISMSELPLTETNGMAGIYVGRYKVEEDDETENATIRFRLDPSFWGSVKGYAKGKVSILPKQLPRVGELIGKKPFINVGHGGDRLGGAKYGYLQPGIRVTVAGKERGQYKIALAGSVVGWIPDEYVKLLPSGTPFPRSLAGSVSVTGNDTLDIVSLSLGQKLPFFAEQQLNPTAIVIDVFGATSNTNWMTHHLTAKEVRNASWDQIGEDHYRLTLLLRHTQHWGFDCGYEGNALRIKVRRPPVIASQATPLNGLTIAVDAGHGGEAEGAVGATGALEKTFNLSMAKYLEAALKTKGAKVIMTRTEDANIMMYSRMDTAVNSGAQLFVAIHCNATGSNADMSKVSGVSTYYRYYGFQPLADIMYKHMLELGLNQFGVVGSFNFVLNAPIQMPNVLVEVAFMSNPEDEMKLMDDAFRKSVADKITAGFEEFVLAKATEEEKK
jgi:N-acetylmuramoyl-L-alanine amidase